MLALKCPFTPHWLSCIPPTLEVVYRVDHLWKVGRHWSTWGGGELPTESWGVLDCSMVAGAVCCVWLLCHCGSHKQTSDPPNQTRGTSHSEYILQISLFLCVQLTLLFTGIFERVQTCLFPFHFWPFLKRNLGTFCLKILDFHVFARQSLSSFLMKLKSMWILEDIPGRPAAYVFGIWKHVVTSVYAFIYFKDLPQSSEMTTKMILE